MKNLFRLSAIISLVMTCAVACDEGPKVLAPIYVPNVDSLKTYVEKALQTNDPKDQYFAAEYYLQQYTQEDTTKAIDLLTKSAAQNFPWAANQLGNIFSADSTNTFYNIQKAIEFYELGVKNGSDRAMTNLANLYINGKGVEVDYTKALQLRSDAILGLLSLAEEGDMMAQYRLGENLLYGYGVPNNEKAGYVWIKKSMEQGCVLATLIMGYYYMYGYGGIEKDPKEAFEYYLRAADKGSEWANYYVALCYSFGNGVEINLFKAHEYNLKAANLGIADAMFEVALDFQNGRGVINTDYTQAFKWYQKCAERGNTHAMNNIGAMYQSGQGVAKDEQEAFRWFMKAAQKGDAFSQRVVGDCFFNGAGVETDNTKAFEWYMKSAQGGDKTAMQRVAICYLFGYGVPKDKTLADHWYVQSQG